MNRATEVLFVNSSAPDLETLLHNLRPEVESIVLDVRSSAAQQIAVALEGREALDAVHVVAHGAPGRVVFASDEWTINTLDGAADDLAAIGKSLGDKGELRLWSCETGAGKLGEDFVEGLQGRFAQT